MLNLQKVFHLINLSEVPEYKDYNNHNCELGNLRFTPARSRQLGTLGGKRAPPGNNRLNRHRSRNSKSETLASFKSAVFPA